MATHQTKTNITRLQPKPSLINSSLPTRVSQGVNKWLQGPLRRSARLLDKTSHIYEQTRSKDRSAERKPPFPSPTSGSPIPQRPSPPPQTQDRKRKRSRGTTDLYIPTKQTQKRPRTSSAVKNTPCQGAENCISNNKAIAIDYWRKKGTWPKEYFEQYNQTREQISKKRAGWGNSGYQTLSVSSQGRT
ncbi:hypothetical protein V8E54_014721 [Elaphomyces granulatus]